MTYRTWTVPLDSSQNDSKVVLTRSFHYCVAVRGQSEPMFVREPVSATVPAGSSDTFLHCVVNNTQGAQVQWFRNGFFLGGERDLPAYPRYRIDGSEALG